MTDSRLVQLQWLRAVVWLAQAATLFLFWTYLPEQQRALLAVLLGIGLAVMLGTRWWQQQGSGSEDGGGFFAQLLVDCLLLTAVLYVAGGATNPFVSYYLVPVALGAATLSRKLTSVLTLFCLTAYSVLLFWHLPLDVLSPHHHHAGAAGQPSLHVIGMWLNFGLSAGLITWFVVSMAETVRRQRERIIKLREQQLMDENIMAVASLAAGAAHELGTPLSSLAVMLGDLRQEPCEPGLDQDLRVMQEQVRRCQHSLQQLAMTAREHQAGNVKPVPVSAFIERLLTHWRVLRPEWADCIAIEPGPDVLCRFALTMDQALINLFNNAADAAIQRLEIRLAWDRDTLRVVVCDDGPGIQPDVLEQRTRVKRSESGMGLGLLLSHATLERVGGQIRLSTRDGQGTRMDICVPLQGLARLEEEGVA